MSGYVCGECPETRRRGRLCHGIEPGQLDTYVTPYNMGKCPRRVLLEQPDLVRAIDTFAASDGKLGPDFDERPVSLIEGVSAYGAGRAWRTEREIERMERERGRG